jgi:hypothetical protein
MAISKIPSAGFQDNVKFRNIIINGDMSIAQRGTSASSLSGVANSYDTCDRWIFNRSNAGTWTQSQSTDVPTGQGFAKSLKMDCTTADASLSTGDYLKVSQYIEGQNLQYLKKGTANAESMAVSFWVKSNKTGTYICEIFDNDNSRSISKSYTINSANTWEKKIINIPADTTGALDNDNNTSLLLTFWLAGGTDYTSGTLQTDWGSLTSSNRAVGQVNLADSTSNEWYITGVQLEAGTTASDFEFLPVDVNYQRCARYFQKSYELATTPGTATGTGIQIQRGSTQAGQYIGSTINLETRMRAIPTVTSYDHSNANTSGQWNYDRNGASGGVSTGISGQGEKSFRIESAIGANWVVAQFYGHYTANAEL